MLELHYPMIQFLIIIVISKMVVDDGHYLGDLVFLNLTIDICNPFHLIKNQVNSSKTRNTCIAEARKAREEEAHKMSGMENGVGGGENWNKLHCVAWEGGFQHWL